MSLMERMKRSGPRIDPWGTPERTGVGLDMRLPTLTDWVRPERYECNQEYRLGGRLMEFNLLRRDEWLTESKWRERHGRSASTALASLCRDISLCYPV